MTAETATASDENGRRLTALHIATLSCLALAQPLLDLIGRQPEFLVIRRIGATELGILLGVLLFALPLPFLTIALAAGRTGSKRARIGTAVAIGLLAAPIALRIETASKLVDGTMAIAIAVLAGFAAAIAYNRLAPFRSFVTLLSPALLAVPLLFLLQPGVRRALAPPKTPVGVSVSEARAPVFFLIFDELALTALIDDEGNVDARRYPNLAKLAGRSTWYRNAYTIADTTSVSIPAILTGNVPLPGSLPLLADHPVNLFTLLGNGYTIRADEPITRLCPPELNKYAPGSPSVSKRIALLATDLSVVWLHLVLPPTYTKALPPISSSWEGFAAPARTRAARAQPKNAAEFYEVAVDELTQGDRADRFRMFLRTIDDDDERALYFAHVMLPHTPWERFPGGRLYDPHGGAVPGLEADAWGSDAELVRLGAARYLLQVEFFDRIVGELTSTLEKTRLFDRALVVLVSDHGVSFRPGEKRRGFSSRNASDVIPVPLLIKAPFQKRGEVVDMRLTTLDILPTVMRHLGADLSVPHDATAAIRDRETGHPTLRLSTMEQGVQEVDLLAIDAGKRTSANELKATIGPSDDVYRIGRFGPRSELLGRHIDSFAVADSTVRASLFDPDAFRDYDPRGSRAPALVKGAVKTSAGTRAELALVVNRTIVAIARSGPDGESLQQFAAMLPESVLAKPIDGLSIYRIVDSRNGAAGEVTLERTTSRADRSFALKKDSTGRVTALVVDGVEHTLGKRLDGWIESTELKKGVVRISGWAADVTNKSLASEVVAFHNDQYLASGGTWVAKGYVAEGFHEPAYMLSGFQLDAAAESVARLEDDGVRVFTLSEDGHATELGRLFLRLGRDAAGEYLVRSDGVRFAVAARELEGATEAIEPDGSGTTLRGWCADRSSSSPVDRVVVTLDDRVVREEPSLEARAVSSTPVARSTQYGFRLHFDVRPAEAVTAMERGRARVFAISARRTATELRLTPASGRPVR